MFAQLLKNSILLNEKMSKLNKSVSNSTVDNLYEFEIKNGVVAGKLLGAGSGGFFYFYQNLFKKKNIN